VETGDWKLELTNAAMNLSVGFSKKPTRRSNSSRHRLHALTSSLGMPIQPEAEAKRHSQSKKKNEEKPPDSVQDLLDSDINGIEPR